MNTPDLSRRQVIALGVGAFVVAAAPFLRWRRARLVRRVAPVMGTMAELAVVHEHSASAHAAMDVALEELRVVDRLMSRFDPHSDVGRANRLAVREGVTVSLATAHVLGEALAWAEATDGAFDPCLGRLVALWDIGQRSAPPPARRVRPLAGRRLYRALDVSGGNRPRVRFTDPDAAIDLGGIAVGYGVDRAVAALRRRGITRALVNVGGDLYAMGLSEDGDPWRIGIRSPAAPFGLAGEVTLSDAAVTTSGDYFQYFDYHGRRYHHLLDPATGEPRRTAAHSVTVLAGSCLAADAGATAAFGMEPGRAAAMLARRAPGASIVRII